MVTSSEKYSIFITILMIVALDKGLLTKSECDLVSYRRSGTFSWPLYNASHGSRTSESCKWRIAATPGEKIVLNVTNLDTEKTVNCSSAYLEVRDGYWYNSPLLGRFCGEGQLDPIVSTRNKMLVTYVAEEPQRHRGFFASYEAICGRDYFIDQATALESPNYPGKYPLNKMCIWRIIVPENQRVVLKFHSFEIESHRDCLFDYVEVRDGFTTDSELIGKYCDQIPPEIVSSTSSLLVKFVSDASIQKNGFSATIMNEYDECTESHDCAHDCINTMGGYRCSCKIGFELHSNGKDCERACGGILETSNGTITSPWYPDPYPSNETCTWEIVTEPQIKIFLNFTHLDLNGKMSRKRHKCDEERLEIFSKFENNTLKRHGVYCGNVLPEAISSESNTMKIVFKSGQNIGRSGFALDFSSGLGKCSINNGNCRHGCLETKASTECVCKANYILQNNGRDCSKDCHFEISSFSGTIASPNFPEKYSPFENCSWLFTSTPGHRIQISFLFFQIESEQNCQYDNVIFYNGSSINDASLGKFCGVTWPSPIISSSNELLMTFKSDSSNNFGGFQATYSSICGGTLDAQANEKFIYSYTSFGTTDYRSNTDCQWTIRPYPSFATNLTFTSFELEDTDDCLYDYLEVLEEVNSIRSSVGKFCGHSIPLNIVSYNTLFIHFRSDDNIADKGFALTYSSVL